MGQTKLFTVIFHQLDSENFNIFRSLYITQSNIYDGAFIVKKNSHGAFEKMELWSQPGFTCSKLTIETLEQGVKYVQI